jgi:hypothetical protein
MCVSTFGRMEFHGHIALNWRSETGSETEQVGSGMNGRRRS